MKTGMVIVNYNDYESTIRLINNVKSYKKIDYIVIVDNNSTNDSYIKLNKYKSNNINIIKSDTNKGYSAALNLGVKEIVKVLGESKIIISNPDITINSEEDIKKLLNLFDKDVAIVAPNINQTVGFNRGWKIPTPYQDIIMNIPFIGKNKISKYLYYDDENYKSKTTIVEAVSGCFFIVDSEYLKNVNYFDESVFLYYEENIFGYKIKELNKKILVSNEVFVTHDHSTSIDSSLSKRKKVKILKTSQLYFHENYSKCNFVEKVLLKLTASITNFLLIFKK